eukprot:828542-Pelagomonas_calceolata.AAC.1
MEQPYLQQVNVQAAYDFLLQHNNKLFSPISELMDNMLTGEDQSQADQPSSLAECPPIQSCKSPAADHQESVGQPLHPFDGASLVNHVNTILAGCRESPLFFPLQCAGYKGKRPQSRRLTASLFIMANL